MATAVACSMLLAWLVGAGLLVRLFHLRAWRVEAAELSPSEQAYRLHRLMLLGVAITGGYAVPGLAAVAATTVALDDTTTTRGLALATALAGLPICVAPIIAAVRVIRRAYARVCEAPIRAHGRRFVLLFAVLTTALLSLGIAVGRAVFPLAGGWHIAGMLLVYLVVLVAVQVLIAPLVIVSLRAQPLPDETRRRLRRLAVRMGVQVRDIRTVPGREHRIANAAQIGAIPGLRYIVVTDYLLDRLAPDEVDAVVAHELGHVRGRHLTMKLLSVFGVWAGLEAVAVAVNATSDLSSALLLLVPVLVAFPLGLLAAQGLFGVRFEQRADDAAAGAVGGARLVAALESIGRLNAARPDTGRLWTALTQHPGLDDRLRRLRTRVPATTERVAVLR